MADIEAQQDVHDTEDTMRGIAQQIRERGARLLVTLVGFVLSLAMRTMHRIENLSVELSVLLRQLADDTRRIIDPVTHGFVPRLHTDSDVVYSRRIRIIARETALATPFAVEIPGTDFITQLAQATSNSLPFAKESSKHFLCFTISGAPFFYGSYFAVTQSQRCYSYLFPPASHYIMTSLFDCAAMTFYLYGGVQWFRLTNCIVAQNTTLQRFPEAMGCASFAAILFACISVVNEPSLHAEFLSLGNERVLCLVATLYLYTCALLWSVMLVLFTGQDLDDSEADKEELWEQELLEQELSKQELLKQELLEHELAEHEASERERLVDEAMEVEEMV